MDILLIIYKYNLEIEPLTDEIIAIDQIKSIEAKLNTKIHEDYIEFLLKYNGGRITSI